MATSPWHPEADEPQRELVVATDWINQPCSVPGCTVVIRSRVGQQPSVPVCKWCTAGTAHYRHAESAPRSRFGPCLTREEFGTDLYAAIVVQAALVQALRNLERLNAAGKKREAKRVAAEIRRLEGELTDLADRGTIAPDDLRRLLSIGAARKTEQGAA